jgi:hypothetical protein
MVQFHIMLFQGKYIQTKYLLLDIYKKINFVALEGKKHKIDTWVSRTNTW